VESENQSTNQERLQVTCEFDLPIGYEGKDGTLHRHVVMRRVRTGDLIGSYDGLDLKALRSDNLNVSDQNPAAAMLAMGAFYKIMCFMFGRVIIRLGDLEGGQINRTIFHDLTQVDMNFLMDKYNKLNGLDLPELAPGQEAGRSVPFGGLETS